MQRKNNSDSVDKFEYVAAEAIKPQPTWHKEVIASVADMLSYALTDPSKV